MGENNSERDASEKSGRLPPVGRGMFVKNQGRDRYAYRDEDGRWRDYYNGDILEGEVIYDHHD